MKLLGRRGVLQFGTALSSAALLVSGCAEDSSTVTTSTVTVTSQAPAPTAAAPTETTRDFPVGAFTAVHLDAHFDVVVNIGDPTSVRAQGVPEALDLLDIRVEGSRLIAGVKPNVQWPANARVTVTVTTPTLTAAELSGSGDMRIGPVQADALTIGVDGSGEINVPELTVKRLEISSSGSGDVQAGGAADDAVIKLDGSGEADLEQLSVKRAEVSMDGSGDLDLMATETVSGSKSGSGELEVSGGAACSVSNSGSGDVTCS